MIRFSKKCNNCHIDVDIDPNKPLATCPYCGKPLLYSIEETNLIKLAEQTTQTANSSDEKNTSAKPSSEITVFTPAKGGNKYKGIAIGLAAVLILFIGYFMYSNIKPANTQNAGTQNVSYEAAVTITKPALRPSATHTQIPTLTPTSTPTPTATPKVIYAPPAKSYIGRNYQDVEKELRNAGFKNIKTYAKKDMLIDIGGGHIGEVDSVSIRGNFEYDANTPYNETDVVSIYYHSLKNSD